MRMFLLAALACLFAPLAANADPIVVHMNQSITLSNRLVCSDLDSAKKVADALAAWKDTSDAENKKFQDARDATTCKPIDDSADLRITGAVAYKVPLSDGGYATVIPTVSKQSDASEIQNWFVKNFSDEIVFDQEPLPPEHWAAQTPNNENAGPVVWADTRAEAIRLALEACNKTSKTCSKGPAVTDDMSTVFVSMCCLNPKLGCGIAPGSNVADAKKAVQKMFSDVGYSSCKLKGMVSAGDGKPVK